MNVQINGENHVLPEPLPLLELLQKLNWHPRLVAIELNGEILHRQFWAQTIIQDADTLEVVTIVGGG